MAFPSPETMRFRLALSFLLWRTSRGQNYPPEDCLEVTFAGCYGLTAEPTVNGVYERNEGACGSKAAYYNKVTEMYLTWPNNWGEWSVRPVCEANLAYAGGSAGDHPFLNTYALWDCYDTAGGTISGYWATGAVSITCSLYDGQPIPCNSGTFSPLGPWGAGMAPNGLCEDECPTHLEYSPKGKHSPHILPHILPRILLIVSCTIDTNSIAQKGPPLSPSASPSTTTSTPFLMHPTA